MVAPTVVPLLLVLLFLITLIAAVAAVIYFKAKSKVCITFTVEDKPGSLAKSLKVFKVNILFI